MPRGRLGGGIRAAVQGAVAKSKSGGGGSGSSGATGGGGGKIRSALERAQSGATGSGGGKIRKAVTRAKSGSSPAPKQARVSKISGSMRNVGRGVAPLARGPKKATGTKSGRARAGSGVRTAAGLMKRDEDKV